MGTFESINPTLEVIFETQHRPGGPGTSERWGAATMGFPQRLDNMSVLNWAELRTELFGEPSQCSELADSL